MRLILITSIVILVFLSIVKLEFYHKCVTHIDNAKHTHDKYELEKAMRYLKFNETDYSEIEYVIKIMEKDDISITDKDTVLRNLEYPKHKYNTVINIWLIFFMIVSTYILIVYLIKGIKL